MFSETSSRRSFVGSIRSRALDALSIKSGAQPGPDDSISRVGAGANDKNLEQPVGEGQDVKPAALEQPKDEEG